MKNSKIKIDDILFIIGMLLIIIASFFFNRILGLYITGIIFIISWLLMNRR